MLVITDWDMSENNLKILDNTRSSKQYLLH